MKRTLMAMVPFFCAAFLAISASGQDEQADKDLTQNLHNIKVGGTLPARTLDENLQQPAAGVQGQAPVNSVPMWSNVFRDNTGRIWPVTMVGMDPSIAGAGTTNVPVVIIPLRVNFTNASISPSDIGCVDTDSALTRVVNSPLFDNNITWFEGNTVVGVTQFTDGFQRANFWNYVTTINPNYHVLLNPVQVTPEAFLNVPANLGGIIGNACAGHPVGGVAINYIDSFIRSLISSLGIPPSTFTLVVTYDVGELLGGGGLFLGYHTAVSNANGTWTYAIGSYTDPNILNLAVKDVSVLSHELGEWMDNPVGSNMVPQWGNVGQVQGCQNNLEVGDPLSGFNSTVFMNDGTTYTVQDLAFMVWFARQNPSLAVNGWYTTRGTYTGPSKPCPPGGTN